MANNEIKMNFSGMEHLQRLLKSAGASTIKIGILGSTNARPQEGLSNSQIGFIQEFGRMEAPRIPARSFLRMPLKAHLKEKIKKSKVFSEQNVDKAIAQGDAGKLVKKLALLGEQIVLEAFETSGDGKWAPNADITVYGGWMKVKKKNGKWTRIKIKGKGSDKPLIDTGELRKSITSQVVKK